MTDYEKLLEEADVTVRVLRASVPMVNADEAEMIRRLAAALREVMADAAKSRALDEERFALFRGMQEQRDTALSDVEAMRARLMSLADKATEFIGEHGYETWWVCALESVGLTIDDEGFVRALDASATPSGGKETK